MTVEELESLQRGHLIFNRSGNVRVVRQVSRWKKDRGKFAGETRVYYAAVTIKACSWTKRCYTLLGRYDLLTKYELVNIIDPLNTKLDRQIDHEIQRLDSQEMCCCDVKGID